MRHFAAICVGVASFGLYVWVAAHLLGGGHAGY